MRAIIRREWKNYMKNPLYWIALIVMAVGIWNMNSAYLGLHYFRDQADLESREADSRADADITEGYMPQGEERMKEEGLSEIRKIMVSPDFGMDEKEADRILGQIRQKQMSLDEIDEYLEQTCSFLGAGTWIEEYEYGRTDVDETNGYLKQKLEEHPYSWYLARKFTDSLSLFMGFGSAVLLAFLFFRDTRKDMWELLHTKPVGAVEYVTGKALGGYLSMLLLAAILTGCFAVLGWMQAESQGFPWRTADFAVHVCLYLLPNLLMTVSIYAAVAILFGNPLPGIPVIFLYMLYSNMGTTTENGYEYLGRPLAIMIRFDGKFFETEVPRIAVWSQPLLLAASLLLLAAAAAVWKRRRYG